MRAGICSMEGLSLNEKAHSYGLVLHWTKRLEAQPECGEPELAGPVVEEVRAGDLALAPGWLREGDLLLWHATGNSFGGFGEQHAWRLRRLIEMEESRVRLPRWIRDESEPWREWGPGLSKRIGKSSTHKSLDQDLCDRAKWLAATAGTADLATWACDSPILAAGDSHTPSYARFEGRIAKRDGLRLATVLKMGMAAWIAELFPPVPRDSEVRVSLGSVDIRHHVRNPNSDSFGWTAEEAAAGWISQARQAESSHSCSVVCCAPVPVCADGRKIPKSGQFMDRGFWGSWEDRAKWTWDFSEVIRKRWGKMIRMPQDWYALDAPGAGSHALQAVHNVHVQPRWYWAMRPGDYEHHGGTE